MYRLNNILLVALAIVAINSIYPSIVAAQWTPHPQYDTLMIHVNGNAGVPVLADTEMTIRWSFPNQVITGIEYFVTGPTPAGTQNTPGLIQSTLAVGSVVISARNLIGNLNIGVGEYTLHLRKKGIGNNYLSLPFKVVPENPQILTVTPDTCGSITITWSPVAGADSYTVQSDRGGFVGETTDTRITHANLMPSELYRYSIQSVKNRIWSLGHFFATQPGALAPRACPGTQIPPPVPTPSNPPPSPTPTPTPTIPFGTTKSDRVLAYTISVLQYVQRLVVYERNPVGTVPVAPAPIQF